MRRFLWILPLLLIGAIACGEEDVKMPWEDDLGKEERPNTPSEPEDEPDDQTPPAEDADEVGKTLSAWSEGFLDIHTISTGRGECLFVILPDGTTMVIDAGEFSRETSEYKNVQQRPNALVRPTETYANYIRHFMPLGHDMVDYFHLSHFHMDHMGNLESEYSSFTEGGYVLSGVTALYHRIPFREVVDRAYGAYEELAVGSMSEASLANYKKFLNYNVQKKGLKASQFELGAVNQFAMLYNASAYPELRIDNICSNCKIWENGKPVDIYAGKSKAENAASCGLVIRYGGFDFLTAGDIGDYQDLEYRVAKVAGRVDAAKAHHHLSPHSMCKKAMQVMLPQTMVATSFYVRDIQPDKSKFDYIADMGCRLYCTSVGESLLKLYPADYAKCSATSGHIVIRVAPKGDSYKVYVLDDSNNSYKIKLIDGPFESM